MIKNFAPLVHLSLQKGSKYRNFYESVNRRDSFHAYAMVRLEMSHSDLREQILALIYSDRKPEQAVLILNRIIKQTPERSDALALKAYALNKMANSLHEWKYSENALESADRAIALNPDDDIALISKGWALIDLKRAGEAISPLERATKLSPGNEYAWYNLAWAQYLTGNSAASTASIRKALQVNPANAIIRRGKVMMEKGLIPSHLRKAREKS